MKFETGDVIIMIKNSKIKCRVVYEDAKYYTLVGIPNPASPGTLEDDFIEARSYSKEIIDKLYNVDPIHRLNQQFNNDLKDIIDE